MIQIFYNARKDKPTITIYQKMHDAHYLKNEAKVRLQFQTVLKDPFNNKMYLIKGKVKFIPNKVIVIQNKVRLVANKVSTIHNKVRGIHYKVRVALQPGIIS